nr:putative ribonuclease H-like domain-containing protein [Tanacetum cinerariifolium]
MLFLVWSTSSSNPQNKEGDAAFDGKEHDAEKPESAVNLSPSSSALSGEQDDMTKKKDKGKSPVEYFTGNKDLNANFKDYSKDSSNDMEDIAYSDHENIGAEVDFNNLETSITGSPIPTIGMHKDHPKFGLIEGKSASTPIDTEKPLLKDPDGKDVDVHIYKSMIGYLMYLTSSRPDIMFAVCACARFQVTPKVSHLHKVKRIFRYLKGKPDLGLWYPKYSPFDLVAYSDSDYAGASLDRKSTTGGCQFLGCRLISWQRKKQTVVATSSTEAEYVAGASCCVQVLWIQNQMLDYGYNIMHTIIYIDNSSTICIIKNPVLHSKTKHIEIRHHFIRDCNVKKLIQVVKIPTENNFADLLTKALMLEDFNT